MPIGRDGAVLRGQSLSSSGSICVFFFRRVTKKISFQAVAIECRIVDVPTIKYIGYAWLMNEFIHLRAIIFLGYGDRCLLWHNSLLTGICQSHMDFDAGLRLSKFGPFKFLQT